MSYANGARRWMWGGLLAMLTTTPALAEVRVGAVGTHNASGMSHSDSEYPFVYSSWGAGGVVEVDLGKNLALVSRPMFMGKGSTGALVLLPGDTSSELHLRYFEIPLLLKLSSTGRVAPYLIAGPSLGLRRSAETVREDYGGGTQQEDSRHDTKPVELSLDLGVGVSVRAGRAYGFFEAAWVSGLTQVSREFGRNRGLQFRLGVALRLGS
jgi:hypothetical protein